MTLNMRQRAWLKLLHDVHLGGGAPVRGLLLRGEGREELFLELEPGQYERSYDIATARALAADGYLSMTRLSRDGFEFATTREGRQLVTNNFQETPSGAQLTQVIAGAIGSLAVSGSGQATAHAGAVGLDPSAVVVLEGLLAELLDEVRAAPLDEASRRAALAEATHLTVELRKPQPDRERLEGFLRLLRESAGGAKAVVELLARIAPLLPPLTGA